MSNYATRTGSRVVPTKLKGKQAEEQAATEANRLKDLEHRYNLLEEQHRELQADFIKLKNDYKAMVEELLCPEVQNLDRRIHDLESNQRDEDNRSGYYTTDSEREIGLEWNGGEEPYPNRAHIYDRLEAWYEDWQINSDEYQEMVDTLEGLGDDDLNQDPDVQRDLDNEEAARHFLDIARREGDISEEKYEELVERI
ncbi:hypothetical protein FRC06_011190 [Ceratobasidium sp. 370]|nr:hypothetical protein FRC06_011190 [Ceratobasidium sp. 370]